MQKNKTILFLLASILLVGCSSSLKKTNQDIKKNYAEGNFKQSLEIVEKSDLKKEKKNRLLYLAYRGKLYFNAKKYAKAAKIFEQAIELIDREFEKSSEKFYISSEKNAPYYGEFYEISHMFHYQALSFLLEGKRQKNAKDKNRLLQSTRAVLSKWNSFNQALAREFPNQVTKLDLLNKIIAANLHEQLGSRSDLSISLQLYLDAIKYFSLIGPTIERYNSDFKTYNQELYQLIDDEKLNINQFIKDKKNSKRNQQFSDFRNQLISKTIKFAQMYFPRRLREVYRICREHNPTLVKRLRKKKSKPDHSKQLVTIVLEEGIISEKEAEEFHIGLRGAIDQIEDEGTRNVVRGIGVPILTYFALGPLGLGSYSRSGTTHIYVSHNVGTSLVEEVGIEFSLPKIVSSPNKKISFISQKSEFSNPSLELTLPNNEFLQQNVLEKNRRLYWSRAKSIGIKYILAMTAAYATYQGFKQGNKDSNGGGFLAKAAALATFLAMTKTIKHLEEADLRSWALLPKQTKVFQTYLEPGKHKLNYQVGKSGPKQISIQVQKGYPNVVYLNHQDPIEIKPKS